jgi:hypothetical protein
MAILTSTSFNDERRETAIKVLDVDTEAHAGTTYMTFSVAGTIGGVLYDEVWYGIAYKHFKDSSVWFSLSLGYNPTAANDVLPPAKFESLFDTPRNEMPMAFTFTARGVGEHDAMALAAIGIEMRALLEDCHMVDQFGERIHVRDNRDCERSEHGKAIKG